MLDLLSSIRLGIVTLSLIFVYSWIGSAGIWLPNWLTFGAESTWIHRNLSWTQIHLRQAPGLEMTEFEWFHWWVFDALIALLCMNLVVATLRRIPFKVVNLGVWMIHAGIIILALGSVYYFSTKLEGDAPVARRTLHIDVPGAEPAQLLVKPGNQAIVGQPGNQHVFRIVNIDPHWELRSGEDEGKTAYGVTVAVSAPQRTFMRQLIAGHPQYTEDLIRTDDPEQPFQRAVKVTGEPILEPDIRMGLAYAPQEHFYLVKSRAIYLREVPANGSEPGPWVQRPIHDLPRYSDYVSDLDHVFPAVGDPRPREAALQIQVPPVDPDDPMPDTTFVIDDYLRFAEMQTRRRAGGDALDPAATVAVEIPASGQRIERQLLALDPEHNTISDGVLRFVWIEDEAEIEQSLESEPAVLHVSVTDPETGETIALDHTIGDTTAAAPEPEWTEVPGTDYAFDVQSVNDDVPISGERRVSLAVVAIRHGEREFQRWVFVDPALNRDMSIRNAGDPHGGGEIPLDEGIEMHYTPGTRPAPVMLIAGPAADDLRVALASPHGEPTVQRVAVGEPVELAPGAMLTVRAYAARSQEVEKPAIVPLAQRSADLDEMLSMIGVRIPGRAAGDAQDEITWLSYHLYAFESAKEALRRFAYEPTRITLEDGDDDSTNDRVIELMFSRERRPLPAPIALNDFIVTTHIGGFSGETSSIRDWTSRVRFLEQSPDQAGELEVPLPQAAQWSSPREVSVNQPVEHQDYWFFQAQWDPPDEPRFPGDTGSAGLNYTVLGVGNRNGVYIQLFGCCLATIGLIYAFYVKPMIKRRRRQAVLATLAVDRDATEPEAVGVEERVDEPQPIGAGAEERS